jgi:hypothetical protein
MTPSESLASFQAFSSASGVALETCTPREGIAQMFAFYDEVAPVGCSGRDGDMLLFQWGTYDWGSGRNFELNITRQFIEEAAQDDDAISQLSLTYRFEPTTELEGIEPGNLICEGSQASTVVRDFAVTHPAFVAVADQKPKAAKLHHSYV